MVTPVTPTDITPGTTGSWVDVDVTSYVDAGNTAGVILEVAYQSGTAPDWGVRNNGSSDEIYDQLTESSHTWVAIGIDSDDIFEAKIQNTNLKIYIVGYISNSEGSFFTNAVDKSLGSTGSWTDIDVSGDTDGDTSICTFWLIRNTDGSVRQFGLRENGSTDTRYQYCGSGTDLDGAAMSVDGSEIVEGKIEDLDTDFFFTGYLTDNFTSFANQKNYQTGTTGSYEDVDVSGDVPSGNDGAFWWIDDSGFSTANAHVRKNGSTHDEYKSIEFNAYPWTALDTTRVAEQKIADTDLDLYLWGYSATPSAPAVGSIVSTSSGVVDTDSSAVVQTQT